MSEGSINGGEPVQFEVPSLQFLCEQDGPPERDLKSRLSAEFSKTRVGVRRAYLVRARLPHGEETVMLAMKLGDDIMPALHVAQRIFTEMFSSAEALDILPLDDFTETTISEIAKPFYNG